MHHLTAAWEDLGDYLTLEAAISVSEQTMERFGLAGKTIQVPTGHRDDPAYQAAIAPLNEYVRKVTGQPHLKIYHSAYMLRTEGNPIAITDGMNYIVVREMTNEMTILHECAHVIRNTPEESGHDRRFAEIARDLYSRWISPAAGEKFWSLLELAKFV